MAEVVVIIFDLVVYRNKDINRLMAGNNYDAGYLTDTNEMSAASSDAGNLSYVNDRAIKDNDGGYASSLNGSVNDQLSSKDGSDTNDTNHGKQ